MNVTDQLIEAVKSQKERERKNWMSFHKGNRWVSLHINEDENSDGAEDNEDQEDQQNTATVNQENLFADFEGNRKDLEKGSPKYDDIEVTANATGADDIEVTANATGASNNFVNRFDLLLDDDALLKAKSNKIPETANNLSMNNRIGTGSKGGERDEAGEQEKKLSIPLNEILGRPDVRGHPEIRRSEKYPPDCYSFLSLYGPWDDLTFFGMGIVVFLFQTSLIFTMILSVLHPKWGIKGNVDNPGTGFLAEIVATNASPIVRATQIIALMAYVFFGEGSVLDVTVAVETFPTFSKVTSGDKLGCMVFSCTLRFLQGIMAMFAAFLLIITAESSVDIVLNFTAVNFIGQLDNIAFRLAIWGKYGPKLEGEAHRITYLDLPPCMSQKRKHIRFQCTLWALGFVLVASMSAISTVQEFTDLWVTKFMRVQFKDKNLQSFSGCFELDHNPTLGGNLYKRHIYTSFDKSAHFRYCIEDHHWILSKHENVMNACNTKEHALAYSSKMNTFDLLTAFEQGWFGASGTPLDLYVVELNEDEEYGCPLLDNGVCDRDFNKANFQYDGGDCCSATCSHPACGINTITKAFGVSNITGNGFPQCEDPSMVPITILLENFTESERDPYSWLQGTPIENPHFMIQCEGKVVLSLEIKNNMINNSQTVQVKDRAHCNIRVQNQTGREKTIWYVDFAIFNGGYSQDRKILEGRSSQNGFVHFFTIPGCMLDQLPQYSDVYTMYNTVHARKALQWIVNDDSGNSYCRDPSFIDRLGLTALNFAANISKDEELFWISTNPTCLWFPISCNDGNLTELNLAFLNLQGTISNSIGLLRSFFKIDMEGNDLKGTIPTEVGLLTDLISLELNYNALTGTIPSEVGLLTGLTDLYLENNKLIGTIPSEVGLLTGLQRLDLDSNKLGGIIPTEVGLLTGLQWLDLDNNKLIGTIPSEVGLLTGLQRLELDYNALTGTIPSEVGLINNAETQSW